MNTIAVLIDYSLTGLFACTVALILYKALELWAPALVFKKKPKNLVQGDSLKLDEVMESLEAGLPLLATIATAAPFIGLGGTVLHIIEALKAIEGSSLDITLISGPIATALNATLWGLASAVPAAVAYNLMQRQLQLIENRMKREIARAKES